jgi:hypothetical protein
MVFSISPIERADRGAVTLSTGYPSRVAYLDRIEPIRVISSPK